LNYEFRKEAERIGKKWLETNKKVYDETGAFWEKYDVVKMEKGKDGRYPTQKGFGWTDAVFIRLLKKLNLG